VFQVELAYAFLLPSFYFFMGLFMCLHFCVHLFCAASCVINDDDDDDEFITK